MVHPPNKNPRFAPVNSTTALIKWATGRSPTSWDLLSFVLLKDLLIYLQCMSLISTIALNTLDTRVKFFLFYFITSVMFFFTVLLSLSTSNGFLRNGPFSSYLVPLFQNEAPSKTFHMKMSLICIKKNLKGKHILKGLCHDLLRYFDHRQIYL